MSLGRKLGLGLIVLAFIGAKVYIIFSKKASMALGVLGAILFIFSSPAEAK